MKRLIDILNENINTNNILNESLSLNDLKPAMNIIRNFCIKNGLLYFPSIDHSTLDGDVYTSILVYNDNTHRAALMMWKQLTLKSLTLDAVCFFDNFTDIVKLLFNENISLKSKLTLKLNGASLVKSLPMIVDVLNNKLSYIDFDEDIDKYRMFEHLDELCDDDLINEVKIKSKEDLISMKKKSNTAYQRWYLARKNGKKTKKEINDLENEFRKLDSQYKRALMNISSNEIVEISNTKSKSDFQKLEQEYELRATPQERFSDMERYIKMIVAKLHPGLIICGAPGIGKTHRVMKYVKTTHEYGNTLEIIKGRSTAAALYTSLYNYSREGDLIIIDDADEVFEDTNSVNLLKAALDSGDERLVSYGTTRPPELDVDDVMEKHPELEPDSKGRYFCPKSFFFNGNIIFITNLRAGQLDTALRSRCYICELEFTVDESLELIRDIMLTGGNPRVSSKSKQLAYDYLSSLVKKGENVEISLRTFDAVSKVYESGCEGDSRQFKRIVRDFVGLQFARGGKRF